MNCYGDMSFVYDKLIEADIDYDLWGSNIIKFCDEFNVSKKSHLDLACGTGNILETLSKHFEKQVGIDISSDMLTICENKLREKNIKAILLCQDIVQLKLKEKYNLITCCLDGFNYITNKDDLQNIFLKLYSILNDNGLLIFDMNSNYKLSNVLGDNIFNYDTDDVVYFWENSFENEIVDMYLTFFIKEGRLYRRFDEHHRERAYKTCEIEDMLFRAGFKIEKELDDYSSEAAKNTTERITFVVRKTPTKL